MFYDCTTLYFESFKGDDLKEAGYSKDGKHNQPQVILGLVVTEEGLPIGYDVFPGATFEGHTIVPVLIKLKERFNLSKLVVVADSAMLSKENLKSLQDNHIEYVVGARLKQLPKSYLELICNLEDYTSTSPELRIKELPWNNERLILSWSRKRADKDAFERTKKIQQLLKKIQKCKSVKGLVAKAGFQRYLSIQNGTHATVALDHNKIDEAAKFDGIYGVFTNIKDISPQQILHQYHGLWQVEESFRITKHDLKVRPIYHWTPKRIKAHIAISFIAFSCIRFLTYQISLQYQRLSPQVIRHALCHVQYSVIKHLSNHSSFIIPSNIPKHAVKIYHALGLKLSNVPRPL
jgi:transposase